MVQCGQSQALFNGDRTRGSGHKLKHRKFPLNVRKLFLAVRMTKHWHRLHREVMESSSLEIFKTQLETVLGPSCRWPSLSRQVEPENFQRSLPTSTILGFWDSVTARVREYEDIRVLSVSVQRVFAFLYSMMYKHTAFFTKYNIMHCKGILSKNWM